MTSGSAGWSEPPLAGNIRRWRERRGLSLSALARDAEISKSTVSELERGIGNPSLDTLAAIARTLHIPIGFLFADAHTPDDVDIRRLSDAPVLSHVEGQSIAQLLSGWTGRGEVEVSVVTIAAEGRVDARGDGTGATRRIICVEGVVDVGTTVRSDLLAQGDLITFPSDQSHFLRSVNGAARVLIIEQYPPTP